MNNRLDINVSLYRTMQDNKGAKTNLFQFLKNPIKKFNLDE